MFDLPYTTEEYAKYEQQFQQEEKILYSNLPISLKEYEQYCNYAIVCTFDLFPIHIVGEKLKKRDLQHWKAIEDIRVRSLKRLFKLYREW
jgi:hypothetical protein